MKTGIELITEERQEQIEKHGYDIDHDKMYTHYELPLASVYLLLTYGNFEENTSFWPNWDYSFMHKFNAKSDIDKLKIAGALIAAEIDRLQNA